MTDFDDQIAFNIESSAKQAAKDKLDYGGLSRELRSAVREIGFGEDVSEREQVQRRLEELREQKDKTRATVRKGQAKLEEIETEIARLEEKNTALTSRDEKYEASLEMLEETLRDGGRVWPGHGQVNRAAKIGDKKPDTVIQDLKDRNPEVPDHAFVDGLKSSKDWHGFSENP